jgi:hypothetical protein
LATFNKKEIAYFLQVICMATHWIHEWAFLLPEKQRVYMDVGCTYLNTVARDIFNQVAVGFLKDYMMHKRFVLFFFHCVIKIDVCID